MNEKTLDITPELQQIFDTLRGIRSGKVSEPHHLRTMLNVSSKFAQERATKRFVEANLDMLIHHFVKATTDVDGLNALNDAQHERQDDLVEHITEYLLTIRAEILEEKS